MDWPDAVYDRVGNILLSPDPGRRRAAGRGRVRHRVQGELGAGAGGRPRARRHAVRHSRGRVGPPAGRPRLRRLGREVAEQERELGVFFDTIVVCSVTGSTQAGMVAGFAAQGRPRRIIGIDGSAKPEETRDQVARIARGTAELIGSAASRPRTRSCSTSATTPARTASRTTRRSSDAARRAARGDDHRPGVRGQVDGRP